MEPVSRTTLVCKIAFETPTHPVDAEALTWCVEDRCGDVCDGVNLCGTDLGYSGLVLDSCVTSYCCDEYLPCYDDTGCNACLQNPELAGCDTNSLLPAYNACAQEHCPVELCGTGVGYWADTMPIITCNKCLETTCCPSLVACVGGMVPNPPEAAVDLCIECLIDNEGPGCTDWQIADAAYFFNKCLAQHCGQVCEH